MRASESVKSYGFVSLAELSRLADIPVRTLQHWYKTRPIRFRTICEGARVIHRPMDIALLTVNRQLDGLVISQEEL